MDRRNDSSKTVTASFSSDLNTVCETGVCGSGSTRSESRLLAAGSHMKLRILLPAFNILVMYLVVGGAATVIVQAHACADISGQWNVTETANVTCTSTGPITETASDVITMNQSGCNISYIHPQINPVVA